MIRRPYHRKRLADLENLARIGVKSGAVINAKLAGYPQGRFSQSGRSLLESGNFPFACYLNLAPSIPRASALNGSSRTQMVLGEDLLIFSTNSSVCLHMATKRSKKLNTGGQLVSPFPPFSLELTISYHQAPFPSAWWDS